MPLSRDARHATRPYAMDPVLMPPVATIVMQLGDGERTEIIADLPRGEEETMISLCTMGLSSSVGGGDSEVPYS
jgi:hypothetical protein